MLLFENFNEIESICDKYDIYNYTINSDGSIDVDDEVNLNSKRLTKIPLNFNKVTGSFYCGNNKLTSLKGSPKEVGGNFNCSINKLTSLEGGPEQVGNDFNCSINKLTSLEGGPKYVGNDFHCSNNKLISLKGSPEKINHNFNCSYNQLTSLEGGPKEVIGNLHCSYNKLISLNGFSKKIGRLYFYNNPICEISSLFKGFNEFKELLDDYNYLRGTRIIKARFEQACIDAGIEIPEKIEGYDII